MGTMIDWSNPGFLRTYGMAFAASTFLTLVVWLVSVVKRAVSGVEPARALGESIGYLLMSVMASTFAPLIIAEVTDLVDQISHVMLQPFIGDFVDFQKAAMLAETSLAATGPAGQCLVLDFNIFQILCMLMLWMEMIIRNGLIYIGLVMGPTVFAGLVDQSMWQHTRRWIGVMFAVIASKYVTFTVLVLGTGILAQSHYGSMGFTQAVGTLVTAIAVLGLALFVPFVIAKFLPILGDDIHAGFKSRQDLQGKAKQGAQAVKAQGSTIKDLAGRLQGAGGGGDDGGVGGPEGEGAPEMDTSTQALQTSTDQGNSPSPGPSPEQTLAPTPGGIGDAPPSAPSAPPGQPDGEQSASPPGSWPSVPGGGQNGPASQPAPPATAPQAAPPGPAPAPAMAPSASPGPTAAPPTPPPVPTEQPTPVPVSGAGGAL